MINSLTQYPTESVNYEAVLDNQLSSGHRVVLYITTLGTLAVVLAYTLSGLASIIVAVTFCSILWLLRPLLMPAGYGATRIRALSILGIFGLAASYGFWSQIVDAATSKFIASQSMRQIAPWLTAVDVSGGPSIALLAFVAIGLWIVNYYMADRSIAGTHPSPISRNFPAQSFKKRLSSFCAALRQHLVTSDREANWSPHYYADLEAEVEILQTNSALERRKVIKLQTAIRVDRHTQAFLLLGDPGAGKSVALRKLARDMLDEAGDTGRIPIYINLREWFPRGQERTASWTEQSKPSIQELESFVVENIKARGDVFTEEFIDSSFRDLWLNGRLFFIFDSFDEIPELLDADEESWLINALSDVLSRFISSNPMSRGILASRIFRRPTQAFLAQKVLDIRPLSEDLIIQGLTRFPEITRQIQVQLFRDRNDLVPVVRNPFLMTLLGEWIKEHGALPDTQAQLYESYILSRLAQCQSKIAKLGLTQERVLRAATDIAWFVFQSPVYGLEAPVRVIHDRTVSEDAQAVVEILSFARLARVTQNEPKSFAFVHRRFLEYLVTSRLLANPQQLPTEHIPTDSRGRDALVLYAQLCDDQSAGQIARLCWSEVKNNFNDSSTRLRAIHSLRFLTDAYRSRRACIVQFEEDLSNFIHAHVNSGDDLLQAKICLETVGLIPDHQAVPILNLALSGNNHWLQETAFRACRHLAQLSLPLQKSINNYVTAIPLLDFWKIRESLIFSLSLSESLRNVYKTVRFRSRNLSCSAFAILLSIFLAPQLIVIMITLCFYFALMMSLSIVMSDMIIRHIKPKPLSPKEDSLRRQAQRLRQILERRGWLDVALNAARFAAGLAAIGGGMWLVLSPSSSSYFWTFSPVSAISINSWMSGGIIVALGLLSLDWLIIGLVSRAIIGILRSPKEIVLNMFLGAAVFAITGFGTSWLVNWLNRNGLDWILKALVAGCGIIVIGIVLINAWLTMLEYFADRRIFQRIIVSDKMSRQDIADRFSSLKTIRWRLKFVRELIRMKTVAIHNWPSEFKFPVSADPALIELAKLEERWLKLDR